MRLPRFSIAALMGLVLLAAAGLAALRYPSPLAANALFSLMIAALTVALLGLIFGRGKDRVFWTGALAAGVIGFVLHFVPWVQSRYGNLLLSAAVADIIYERFTAPEAQEDQDADDLAELDIRSPGQGRILLVGAFDKFGGKAAGPEPTVVERWTDIERELGGIPPLGAPYVSAPSSMRRVVDCLAVLLSAIMGGEVARWFAARADRARATAAPTA